MSEERIYELLGVKFFRELVFLLERSIHRGSDKQNVNYHLDTRSPGALDRFVKFLFYNGSIHVRNLIYGAIYFLVRFSVYHFTGRSPGTFSKIFSVIIIVFLIKDVYCVMLQRYNYLRIRKRQKLLEARLQSRIKRQTEVHLKGFTEIYDPKYKEQDLRVVRELQAAISKGELIFLSEQEVETLRRLNCAMSDKNTHRKELHAE